MVGRVGLVLVIAGIAGGALARPPVNVFEEPSAVYARTGHSTTSLNTANLIQMRPGDEAQLSLPDDRGAYTVVMERQETAPSGATTWVGYLRDHGKSYRVILTSAAQGAARQAPAFGRLLTPEGEFQLETVATPDGSAQVLVDRFAAGHQVRLGTHGDTRVPPIAAGLLAARAGREIGRAHV